MTQSIHDLPTLLTDQYRPRDPQWLWDRGYRVILRQGVNGPVAKNCDLHPEFKAVGFKTGVWGVTYDPKLWFHDCTVLAQLAIAHAADIVQIDCENSLKGQNPAPIIEGLASYSGPKALNTLGAASGENVFPIDYHSFLTAGYDIVAQAYANIDPNTYSPAHCIYHANKAGIPLNRFHLMIDTSGEGGYPLSGTEWVSLWNEAKIESNDIQIFMAEYGTDEDYKALEAITLRVEQPTAVVPSTPEGRRDAMRELAHAQIKDWRKQGQPESRIRKTRIGLASTILDLSDKDFTTTLPHLSAIY